MIPRRSGRLGSSERRLAIGRGALAFVGRAFRGAGAPASLLLAAVFFMGSPGLGIVVADEIGDALKSKSCPDDLTPYNKLTYSEYCQGMDETTCAIADSGCFEDARRCWDQVNQINKQIFAYNNLMKSCESGRKSIRRSK
jgi:hypothetical protein